MNKSVEWDCETKKNPDPLRKTELNQVIFVLPFQVLRSFRFRHQVHL